MPTYACVFLYFVFTTGVARECIELTLPDKYFLNDSKLNGTILKLVDQCESLNDNEHFNIVEMWERLPKIVMLRNGTSEQCRKDSQEYLDSLQRLKLWALKMFDATAKPPAGILSGNGNQLGDFDQCLSIDGEVKGKYCLASLQIEFHGNENMKLIDNLVHSGHYIRSNITDMSHRVPRYSSILWGVCIPSSCNNFDLEEELSQRLSGLGISVKVHNHMCSIKNFKRPYSFGKTLSITFFLIIILLVSSGTILDDDKEGVTKSKKLLNAFSLKRNLKALFDLTDGPTKVKGVDAYKGINALALIIVHKSMAMAHKPFVNKVSFSTVFGMWWTIFGRSAVLYTDTFLYLSGFLNAKNLLQDLERKGTISLKDRLIARWFRLFPLFMSLMLFCTYILPDMNNGPQWNLVIEEHSRVCKQNMWKSFLFIHNYFGFEDMCLTHTHQIGMDMQLFVATIPLMVIIWKYKTIGWSLLTIIAVASTVLRYLAVYWYEINLFIYLGISVQKLLDTARYSYILPTHRATIYLIGVTMAYLMKSKKLNFKLTNTQSRLLWIFCFILAVVTMVSPYQMLLEGYHYKPFAAALFATFSPILWGVFMSVSHWAICNDYAGKGSAFLESRVFKFFNKISYSVYLTQFPIFFYNVGIQRNAEYYSPLHVLDMPELFTIAVISIITTLAIEMPFNKIYRIYFNKSQSTLKYE